MRATPGRRRRGAHKPGAHKPGAHKPGAHQAARRQPSRASHRGGRHRAGAVRASRAVRPAHLLDLLEQPLDLAPLEWSGPGGDPQARLVVHPPRPPELSVPSVAVPERLPPQQPVPAPPAPVPILVPDASLAEPRGVQSDRPGQGTRRALSLALSGAVLGAPLLLLRATGNSAPTSGRLVAAAGRSHPGGAGRPAAPGAGTSAPPTPSTAVSAAPMTTAASPASTSTTATTAATTVPAPTSTAPPVVVRPAPARPVATVPVTTAAPIHIAPPPTAPPTTSPPAMLSAHQASGLVSYYSASPGTCASVTLAFGTVVTVTDLANGASTTCVVDDRGPFVGGRILDLAEATFAQLTNPSAGVINAHVTW